ncbi:MAG: hypothetical protein QM778_11120 [Myxococcales bacterium]
MTPQRLSLALILSLGAAQVAPCSPALSRVQAQDVAGTSAQPPTWAVRVDPSSRCASDPRFAADVAEPIPPAQRASVDSAELVAAVTLSRANGGLHANIQVYDRVLQSQAGARELDLPLASCRETADSIALVIGVLVEAGRTAPTPPAPPDEPPPPPPPPPPEEEPEEEEPEQVAPPEPEPERKRYAWLGPKAGHDLTIQAGVGWGLLPGAYAGGTVGWGIRAPRVWPIWLSGTGFLPKESADHRGRFSSVYGGIAVCPVHAERGAVRGQLCPSFAAGAIWAEGQQLANQRAKTAAIALVGLDLKGDLRLAGPLALSLTGRLEVPLLRQKFAYNQVGGQTGEIYEVAPLTLTLLAGLSLLFR